jgi:hypothetical protein
MALMSWTFKRRLWSLSIAAAILFGLALFVALADALMAIGGWTAAACANPPALVGSVPQVAIVGALTASLLVGGLTSGWPLRPTHQKHHEHVQRALDQRRVRQSMRVAFIMVFFLLTTLMVLEAVMLQLQVWPITDYVRCANYANTPLAALGGGIYTFLAGRWLWNWRKEQ